MTSDHANAHEGVRDKDLEIDGRILRPDETIHELIDLYEEDGRSNGKTAQGILLIDGRAYERGPQPFEPVYELTDVLEERLDRPYTIGGFNDEVSKKIAEIAERIAREVVPVVAERVIREEIEKLKKQYGSGGET